MVGCKMKKFVNEIILLFLKLLIKFIPSFIVRLIFDLLRKVNTSKKIYKPLYLYAGVFEKKYRDSFEWDNAVFKTCLGYNIFLPKKDDHFLKRSLGVYHPKKLHDKIRQIFLSKQYKSFGEIGPHLGDMTLFLNSIVKNNSENNHVFELDTNFCKFLEESLRINNFKNTQINNCVIGTSKEISNRYGDDLNFLEVFSKLRSDPNSGMSYFVDDENYNLSLKNNFNQKFQPLILKEYFKDKNYVDFWFMDVEGTEVFIIPEILNLNKSKNKFPTIIFETHFERYNQEDIVNLKKTLVANNYVLTTLDDRHLVCMHQE